MRAPLATAFAALIGCGAATPVPAPPEAAPPAVPAPAPGAAPTSSAAAPPSPPAAAPPSAALPPPEPPFPPPACAPPAERTARPGDGVWSPYVVGAPGEPALLYRSVVHPDPKKPQVYLALVAVDLRRVALHLVAGTREPRSTTVPEPHRTGLVPPSDLPSLVAVFNGGFMAHHGAWGMMIGGEVFLPPRPEGCTVVLLRDGSVRIGTHSSLAIGADVTAYRQTPPCLVERGAVQPALLGPEKPRRWGMSETGGVDIRRSAIGVADGGRALLYGSGESITPRQVAEAMRAAGAVDAAELDVNWSYTRFLLYGKPPAPGGPPEVVGTLVPKTKHAHGEYVAKPAERDFFYLTQRPPPPEPPPAP